MVAERIVRNGVVRGGVVIPEGNCALPEGARVQIVLRVASLPRGLDAEFEAWDRAGDEAWRMIEEWEKEAEE